MPNIPSLEELLKKGSHFGHKESKWHPNMAPYIHTSRNGVHIIDLAKTQEQLKKAIEFVKKSAIENKTLLFIGTKKALKNTVKKCATDIGSPYVSERWLGGTITNFKSIHGLIRKLEDLEKQEKDPEYESKYNKKERLDFTTEKTRLEKMIGGIRTLETIPDLLFITDARADKTAIKEAQKKNIPVVAIVDTNIDPVKIDFPIPANDDSIKSVELITNLICEAIVEGRENAQKEDNESKEKTENVKDLEGKQEEAEGKKQEARKQDTNNTQ